jgi:hypothetical protein
MRPSNFIIPGSLSYRFGSATVPNAAGHRIIVQPIRDNGKYEESFNKLISKRWPLVEREYKRWYRSQKNFKLGEIQAINVQSDTTIINMLCEKAKKRAFPLCYQSLQMCLEKVGLIAIDQGSSIHAPMIGKRFKKNNWDKIESIITHEIIKRGINMTFYNEELDS